MKRLAVVLVVLGALLAPGAVEAQTPPRTLDAFVTEANRIPLNASAALRPSAHRLKGEFERALGAVSREIREARAAGRAPAACPPESIELSPRQLLAFLNDIPQTRRQRMSVPDGIRSWLASRYPCPA